MVATAFIPSIALSLLVLAAGAATMFVLFYRYVPLEPR
jgi:hypothetical protein